MPTVQTDTPIKCFGPKGVPVNADFLSPLAFMCSPGGPAEKTILVGDFAFAEICVSLPESNEFKEILKTMRTVEQQAFIAKVFQSLHLKATATSNKALAAFAENVEAEYARLMKVFFIRRRCFEVTRVSTNKIIARIITFPDQISDDYGNNLETHNEAGMNTIRVSHANRARSADIAELYVGHGQGAALAQLIAFIRDEPCILIDGTFLSDVIVQNVVRHEIPKPVKLEPRKDAESSWNVIAHFFETTTKAFAGAIPIALKEVERIVEEQKKEEEAEAAAQKEAAEQEAAADAEAAEKQPSEEEEEQETDAEKAEKYFAKRVSYTVTALIPVAVENRAARTARIPATTLSTVLTEFTTKIKPSSYLY